MDSIWGYFGVLLFSVVLGGCNPSVSDVAGASKTTEPPSILELLELPERSSQGKLSPLLVCADPRRIFYTTEQGLVELNLDTPTRRLVLSGSFTDIRMANGRLAVVQYEPRLGMFDRSRAYMCIGQEKHELFEATEISGLSFDPRTDTLAVSGGPDSTIKLFGCESNPPRLLPVSFALTSFPRDVTPRDDRLLVLYWGKADVLDRITGTKVHSFDLPSYFGTALWGVNTNEVLLQGLGYPAEMRDLGTGTAKELANSSDLRWAGYSLDTDAVVGISQDNVLCLWRRESDWTVEKIVLPITAEATVLSQDGRLLLVANGSDALLVHLSRIAKETSPKSSISESPEE